MIKGWKKALTDRWEKLPEKKKFRIKLAGSALILVLGVFILLIMRSELRTPEGSLKKKALLFFLASFSLWALAPHFKNTLKEKTNGIVNTLLVILMPFVMFTCMHLLFDIKWETILDMKFLHLLLNLTILYLVEGLGYALTLNVGVAITVMSAFTMLFTVVNIYLIRFRQIPLLYSDLSVLGTAGNVAESYDYTPDLRVLFAVVLLVDAAIIGHKLHKNKNSFKKTWIQRIALTAAVAAGTVWFGRVCIYTDYLEENHVKVNNFRPIKTYTKCGGMLTFVRSIGLSIVEKPEGYSPEMVQQIAENYSSDSVKDPAKSPNIIVVMNEAFSDLQSVGNFKTNKPVMPVYDSLKENAIKGKAYVSVFGGKTANSEFEFLTGDTNAFMPTGATPYQIFIKNYVPSLTSTCKKQGYEGNFAMHPFLGDGYNRVAVYDYLGFDKFLTMNDYPQDAGRVRGFISDDADVSRIIQEYENVRKSGTQPFYMFNVTMQNHSPYDMDFPDLPKEITIDTPELKDADAERYLNLIHLSDQSLGKLVDYFKEKDDPTIIVFFGDHEPGLSDAFYEKLLGKKLNSMTSAESMNMYHVPYVIWANYDIEEKEQETTSLNYLRAQMLQAAGMRMTGYDKYLLKLREEVPVITANGYYGKNGSFYELEDQMSPYYQRLKEYQMLQYNHIFDEDNRNAFFALKK